MTRVLLDDRIVHDEDRDVRERAMEALATGWPDERTRVLLAERASVDPDEDIRTALLEELGHWLGVGPDGDTDVDRARPAVGQMPPRS